MPDKHAVLSASSSHRWLACPPSALLCAKEKDKPSEFAMQGTDAHTLCEHKLKTALGQQSKDPVEDLTFFDEEMADCTDMYAQYVMEQLSAAKERCNDPIVLIEQHLDFSQWVPDGFGTGDCVIVADETLTVIDFKYGVGILVDAENNPQMMCYGNTSAPLQSPRKHCFPGQKKHSHRQHNWRQRVRANTKPEVIVSFVRSKLSAEREPNTTWNLLVMILRCQKALKMMK